jgi:betaine lipid synthase
VCWFVQLLAAMLGLSRTAHAIYEARTLEEQRTAWDASWIVRLLRMLPGWLLNLVADFAALLFFNRITLWFGAGVPIRQYELIRGDGIHMATYAARTLQGVASNSHIRTSNYFYLNCLSGKFTRENCPSYLTPEGFGKLKAGAIDALHVETGFFVPALRKRHYSRVVLMDHADWLDEAAARELATTLGEQVVAGGRVIWRSAALEPFYSRLIEEAGFEVTCLQRADRDGYMDRVNMYSSFWLGVKK